MARAIIRTADERRTLVLVALLLIAVAIAMTLIWDASFPTLVATMLAAGAIAALAVALVDAVQEARQRIRWGPVSALAVSGLWDACSEVWADLFGELGAMVRAGAEAQVSDTDVPWLAFERLEHDDRSLVSFAETVEHLNAEPAREATAKWGPLALAVPDTVEFVNQAALFERRLGAGSQAAGKLLNVRRDAGRDLEPDTLKGLTPASVDEARNGLLQMVAVAWNAYERMAETREALAEFLAVREVGPVSWEWLLATARERGYGSEKSSGARSSPNAPSPGNPPSM